MRNYFLLMSISCFFTGVAQPKISFEYDQAGNQVKRSFCTTCRTASQLLTKVEVDTVDNRPVKLSDSEGISYFPNPVNEQLFVKWELIDNNKVKTIELYSLSGQLIKSIFKLENENTQTISFQEYPQGTYLLLILYSNGNQKTRQIIKK